MVPQFFHQLFNILGDEQKTKMSMKNEEIDNFLGLILIFKCLKMAKNAFLESL